MNATDGQLVNISTRGHVGTGDNVLIGGFVIEGEAQQVVIHAIGPELEDEGITGILMDPLLQVFDADNEILISNNNWQDDSIQAQTISDLWGDALPLATDSLSSAVSITLGPGTYTAVVSGNGGTEGVALVEVYEVD